jgi:3-hydroxyisobutyrate dehydrogenase-like beta-hydroxyacid dehydrogenase
MEIGFIGIGRMGSVMVTNLVQAGHKVRVWDNSPSALAKIAQLDGVTPGSSAKDAFSREAVISMLPNDAVMRSLFLGSESVLPKEGATTIHINMATASVKCTDDLVAEHKAYGIPYISAPVFGRPEMAAERNLNVMAAGDTATVDKVQPLFDALAKKTWRLGSEPRQANVTKIAGNLMVACMLESMGEAAALSRAYGMVPLDVLNVIVGSLFDVPVYRIYASLIGEQKFEPPGFDMRLGLKDTMLALAAGEEVNVALPFASVLRDNYLDAIAHGDEKKDWSAMTMVAARRAALVD